MQMIPDFYKFLLETHLLVNYILIHTSKTLQGQQSIIYNDEMKLLLLFANEYNITSSITLTWFII